MSEQSPTFEPQSTAPTEPPTALPEDKSVQHSPQTHIIQRLKKLPLQMWLGILLLMLLVVGGASAFYLSSMNSELRQQASGGYQECAGGVKDMALACAGFREVVQCHNGAFSQYKTCASNERCDAGASSGCATLPPQNCNASENGKPACDTLHSYVICNNGVNSDPIQCKSGETCSNGFCVGGTAAKPNEQAPSTPIPSPNSRAVDRPSPSPFSRGVATPVPTPSPANTATISCWKVRPNGTECSIRPASECLSGIRFATENQCEASIPRLATPSPSPILAPSPGLKADDTCWKARPDGSGCDLKSAKECSTGIRFSTPTQCTSYLNRVTADTSTVSQPEVTEAAEQVTSAPATNLCYREDRSSEVRGCVSFRKEGACDPAQGEYELADRISCVNTVGIWAYTQPQTSCWTISSDNVCVSDSAYSCTLQPGYFSTSTLCEVARTSTALSSGNGSLAGSIITTED